MIAATVRCVAAARAAAALRAAPFAVPPRRARSCCHAPALAATAPSSEAWEWKWWGLPCEPWEGWLWGG
eukprot:6917300-Prymnesium_polylepis.1